MIQRYKSHETYHISGNISYGICHILDRNESGNPLSQPSLVSITVKSKCWEADVLLINCSQIKDEAFLVKSVVP